MKRMRPNKSMFLAPSRNHWIGSTIIPLDTHSSADPLQPLRSLDKLHPLAGCRQTGEARLQRAT
jgi:hypothetical protein